MHVYRVRDKVYSKCSNILDTSCLPKRHRQTGQTQIRLLLKKQSDQGLPCLLFGQALLWFSALVTNILLEMCLKYSIIQIFLFFIQNFCCGNDTATNPAPSLHKINTVLCRRGTCFLWMRGTLNSAKSLYFLTNIKFQNSENAIRWPWCIPLTYFK